MTTENVELVRRYYENWNRGDIQAVIEAFAPDVEWYGHPRLPEPGPYRSRAEVERWMAQFQEAWGTLSARPVDLLDAGDRVIALVHMTGTGRGSGVQVQGGIDVHVIALGEDGVSAFRIYPGDLAAEHAGLTEAEMEVVTLRVASELSEQEIAARLGTDASAVSAILDAAFAKVRGLPAGKSA